MGVPAGAGRAVRASQDDVRRRNLGNLLRLLHEQGPSSRADLTASTGLNRSTVKTLTAELVDAGLVRESTPVGRGATGRPSIPVEPASESIYVISLDVGVAHLTAVRVGLGGVVLDRRALQQSPGDYDVGRTLDRLARLVRTLLAAAPPDGTCVGIGVGVCGVVGTDDGIVRFAPNIGWVEVPLRELLVTGLGTSLPVDIGNDGDLGALAEHVRGVGRGVSDLVVVSGEVGIGGGVVVEGRPFRGSRGYAGEVGHMSVDPAGQVCRCGRRGCWETVISDQGLLAATGARDGTTAPEVLAAYARGEGWTLDGVRRVAQALGTGVANLVNLFDPQVVVFAGAVRHLFAATEPLVREAVELAFVGTSDGLRLQVTGLGDDSVVLGAAELAFGPLLEDPLRVLAASRPLGPASGG